MARPGAMASLLLLLGALASGGAFKVTPLDLKGADGVPDAVDVESPHYKFRFLLGESGSAESVIYKPLNHELRAEDYYGNRNHLFRDWVRLADPDPATGFTRRVDKLELETQSRLPAAFSLYAQDEKQLILQFDTDTSTAGGQEWMAKIHNRRRLFLRSDSPAILVENKITNADEKPRSILFDVFNSVSLGRAATWVSMPGPEGKVGALDRAEERSSTFLFAPEVVDGWLGGVNDKGLGAGFSFDPLDVDGMQVCLWKTVGSSYHVVMRRQEVPAGQYLRLRYTFMPFTGFGAFDGMNADLAGGCLVGQKATYAADVAQAELKPGATVPVRVFLASGSDREVSVRILCVRKEDNKVVLDETKPLALKVAQTATLTSQVALPEDGLYVLSVVAAGPGAHLKMEKPLEVGKTRLVYAAAPSPGEKRGTRDGGAALGPPKHDPQFKTLDLKFVTPHYPLLKPHAKGPVKALFLTPADSTLAHVREICQRADLTPEHVAVTKIQTPQYELHPGEVSEFRQKLRAGEPQVLVTLGIHWQIGLKRAAVKETLERVRAGMGAVVAVRDLAQEPELRNALAEGAEVKEAPWPAIAVSSPAVRRFTLGKGRLALVVCDWSDYRDGGRAAIAGWTDLRVGDPPLTVDELRWRGFEYAYARLGQCIRWAAGQDSPITITAASLHHDLVVVDVHNASDEKEKPLRVKLTANARTPRWDLRASGEAGAEVPPGASQHEVPLDSAPPDGRLVLELDARDPGNKVLAFGSVAVVRDEWVALRVVPEPRYQSAAAPGKCAIELEGGIRAGRLEVEITDRFGRLLLEHRQEAELQNGKARVELPLEGLSPRCVYHEVVARFLVGDELLAEGSGELFFLPSQPPYAEGFVPGVWGAPERKALQLQAMLKTTHDLGLTLHSHCYDDRVLYATGGSKTAHVPLSAKTRYAKAGEEPKLDSGRLIMHPPLLPSQEAIQATKAAWQAKVREQFESGARHVGIDDERRMSDDFDFHPQTLAGFREWLKGRYANIDELNKTWGTKYADFPQVVPKRRKELGDSPNLAPWLEFRMFIGKVLGDHYMQAPVEWAAEISPELSVGEWGIYEPSAAWPVDWSQVAKCYKHTARYGGTQGVLEELFRCFAPGTRHGQWQGYGMRQVSPGRRIAPWLSLLNGGSFCWFWEMRDNGFLNYAVLTSDLRPTEGYAALAKDEFPDLTGGIDRVILASRFLVDPIAIAYSYPSWLADEAALARDAKTIVEELGFQHRLVNMADVATGQLEKDGCKVLILQAASCLSPEQVDAVRRFVDAGGIALCIGRTGWRDLHGAPHADGPLTDTLIGVVTARATPVGRTMETAEGGAHLWLHVADQGVEAKDAEVLASVVLEEEGRGAGVEGRGEEGKKGPAQEGGLVPVWTVRELGKGKVYWLNASLGAHREGEDKLRESHRAVVDHIIAMAGIKPRCRLFGQEEPVLDAETWYYATPSGRSLFVAHYLARPRKEPVYVHFRQKAHIYEMREKRYCGETDAIHEQFPEGRMRVYALLDYRVTKVAVEPDPPKCAPGEVVRVTCAVVPYGKEPQEPDLHAFRVQVLDASNRELPAHTTVVLAPGGKASVTVPTALNLPPGKYTVIATDAVTGAEGRKYFQVVKPKEPPK